MSILESICREMDFGRRAALVSVVEQSASSPRHAGAAMLVGPDGIVAGTIGGGATESVFSKAMPWNSWILISPTATRQSRT